MMEMMDEQQTTLAVLAVAVAVIALSVVMLRIRHRQRKAGWIPWNGFLFGAIVITAIALAHLFGVQQR